MRPDGAVPAFGSNGRAGVAPAGEALVSALWRCFVTRSDAWAEQDSRGRYRARRGRLERAAVRAHLAGRRSLHVYALAPAGDPRAPGGAVARWGAFDLDAHGAAPGSGPDAAARLLELAERLTAALRPLFGPAILVEATGGRGLHIWALCRDLMPAPLVVGAMDTALSALGLPPGPRIELPGGTIAIERYPKRADLPGRTGAALRLPLGRHPRGGRSTLLDLVDGQALEPVAALARARASAPGERTLTARLGPLGAQALRCALPAPASAPPGAIARARPSAPEAAATYRWAAGWLGLAAPVRAIPSERGAVRAVRCLFPANHANGDRSGLGSAYLVSDGETQLYGCAVCGGGRAMDTLALIRAVRPEVTFPEVLDLAHEIDPLRCPSRQEHRRRAEGPARRPGGRRAG